MRARYVLVAILWTLVGASPSLAFELESEIVYNAETNSYFQLIKSPMTEKMVWAEAKELAESRVYNGNRGRLAVVTSRLVNDFLRDTFGFAIDGATWIGLRYWCEYRKLQWVTGEIHSRTAYSNWHPRWNRNPSIECGRNRISYMPVFYTETSGTS